MTDYNIGAKIKKLRLAKKLTLQAVARETGFSPALISQIENNNVSPPIATLSKIAKFFDVKIGMFFNEDEEEYRYEVVRKGERKVIPRVISRAGTNQGYSYESLSFRKQNKKMEPFLLTVSEKATEENTYSHDGEEFLFVMRGTAELLLDEERVTLEEGDCIYFDSSLKHRLLTKDGNEVMVLAVVTR
ncbi:transcriptional regulator [Geotalea uraniireducens]|uniref:Transcriptional regulator n=1 Tax=Geotalea uraniireducens TaxID=351604 RepID=A0ABM8EH76_9BACT|nr:XRE family transcriptional regulator [Geotalea uraniireducens]BDV41317.1 transcriptional regulator [Geotalea uraniireducens]